MLMLNVEKQIHYNRSFLKNFINLCKIYFECLSQKQYLFFSLVS